MRLCAGVRLGIYDTNIPTMCWEVGFHGFGKVTDAQLLDGSSVCQTQKFEIVAKVLGCVFLEETMCCEVDLSGF